ncbi:glutathione S-transferase family protein [Microbulbifer sp. ANSA001]|uniref:glutathione S-transferase family protein n=1 Tax=Microbulbifer sp. ANSA001 TaxID=3243358 RepID=UPI004042444F
MLEVISFKICPFVQRVTALLEAKKIPYKIQYIRLKDKPQWFLDVSPNGQVPVLITESGIALFESDAIVEYLNDIYPRLEPDISPEQRALDRAWSYQAAKHYLVQCSAQRSADKQTLEERSNKLDKAFEKVEKTIGNGPFFKDARLSDVDIAWLPILHRAAIIELHSGYNFLADFPKMKAWQAKMLQTGLAEKSVPEDFEQQFVDFYLSENTYLGTGKISINNQDNSCANRSCC